MATEERLINANALKSFVCEFCNSINSDEPCEPADCRCMVLIDEQPTVDAVEVVHGRWIDSYAVDSNGKKVYDSIDCSVCEEVYKIETHDREYWKGRFKQCFCCGAKMDEKP